MSAGLGQRSEPLNAAQVQAMAQAFGWQRVAKTAGYTAVAADRGTFFDCTSGTFTFAFTAAATLGSGWGCFVYNSGSGVITNDPNASETIRTTSGAATTLALRQGQGALIVCDGTGFDVIADNGLLLTLANTFLAVQTLDGGTANGTLDAATRPLQFRLAAGDGGAVGIEATSYNAGNGVEIVARHASGTRAAKTASASAAPAIAIRAYGYDGASFVEGAKIRSRNGALASATEMGMDWRFGAVAVGDTSRTLVESTIIDAAGIKVISGTAAAPAIAMAAETNLGYYRVGSGTLGLAISGVLRFQWQNDRCIQNANAAAFGTGGLTSLGPGYHIVGADASGTGFLVTCFGGNASNYFRRAEGTGASPTALPAATEMGGLYAQGYNGSAYKESVRLRFYSSELYTGSVNGSAVLLQTTAKGAAAVSDQVVVNNGMQVRSSPSITTEPGIGQVWARGLGGERQNITTTGAIASANTDFLYARYTGASPDVQGMAAPLVTGVIRMQVCYYAAASTIRHQNATAAAADRIITSTGADIVGFVGLKLYVYDDADTRWRML